MEWRKVKNVIIVILLMVNGFLLLLVGARRGETLRYEQSALEGTVQVLKNEGINVSDTILAGHTGCQPGSGERDTQLELEIATSLLGEGVEGANRGGGLYTYSSMLGELSFRTGGELTSLLADDPVWHTDDPVAHAAELMSRTNVENYFVGNRLEGNSGELVYQQMLNGEPVFSCRILFSYEDGRLVSVSGNLLAMTVPVEESRDVMTLPTVLMHFLEEVLDSGDVCSEILAVEPGYLVNQSFMETIRLNPVWYISTNTADYFVDGVTGDVTRIVES